MVQMIENWTMVDAVVLAAPVPADLPGFASIALRIDRAAPVQGFADLLGGVPGTEIAVLGPSESLAGLRPGAALGLRLRRAPGRIFLDPGRIARR